MRGLKPGSRRFGIIGAMLISLGTMLMLSTQVGLPLAIAEIVPEQFIPDVMVLGALCSMGGILLTMLQIVAGWNKPRG